MQGVVVLLDELGGLVANSSGEVPDEEPVVVPDFSVILQLRFSRQREPEVSRVLAVDGRREVLRTRLRQLRLLVQEAEDPVALALNQVDAILEIE